MSKYLKSIIFGMLCFISFSLNVNANGVSVSSNASTVVKGNGATVYVTVSSDSPLVSIEGSLSCSGAGVTGGLDLSYDDSSNSLKTKTYSYAIKPTSTGTVTCTASGVKITNMSASDWIGLGSAYKSITVTAPVAVTPKNYSSNNYLKSLTVEGSEIAFNKDTLEYSIEVENDVKVVKISGETEDKTARVDGFGDKEVSEGTNKLEVIVTAENGNTKTYIINVNVKELDPIKVTINKKEYTIIRKEGVIDPPSEYYEKTTVKIDNQDVLAYHNAKTKYTLVILKDSKGKANYYIYKDGKYNLYNEYNFGNVTLYIKDMKKGLLPDNYIKTTFSYNSKNIMGYIIDKEKLLATDLVKSSELKDNKFYLFYAMNVENGKDSIYIYDKTENTVQRYNTNDIMLYKDKADRYWNYIIYIVASILIVVLSFVIILVINKRKKHKSKKNKYNVMSLDDI